MVNKIEKQRESLNLNKEPKLKMTKELSDLSINILNDDVLSKMESRDFLRIPREQRLKYVTKEKNEYSKVQEWDNLEFTFTFWKKYNHRLYLKTTAWQLLPADVREIKSNWWIFTRNWLYWEFFDKKWNRLVIHEWTKINISKANSEEAIKLVSENTKNIEKSWIKPGDKSYDLALFSTERWLDISTSMVLFLPVLEWVKAEDRKVETEILITNLERQKWYFQDDYPNLTIESNWKLTKEFLVYYINQTEKEEQKRRKLAKNFGIEDELLGKYTRKQRAIAYKWYRKFEELSDAEKKELEKIDSKKLESFKVESFWKQFIPGSKDAQELFTYAAILAWLPSSWGQDSRLHDILRSESKWIVWIANYKMDEKWISTRDLKKFALEEKELAWENIANSIWVISTATWLWQLTMSNEKYLPNWRESIWIPIDEAIWMLRYIEERYGSVEVASNMYWKTGYYTHAKTWIEKPKQFKEWY